MTEVRLILGDQLNAAHSWFRVIDPNVLYVMAELRQETDYAQHHIQKVLAFFASMRQFAAALQKAGHRVRYDSLDDTAAVSNMTEWLAVVLQEEQAHAFRYQAPDEYRLTAQLRAYGTTLALPVAMDDSEHFLTPRDAWNRYPNHRMEFFYRALRKEYRVLLTPDGKPEGERWNFDAENRQRWPKGKVPPEPLTFAHDVRAIKDLLQRHGVKTVGSVNAEALLWPITRRESRALLDWFIQHALPEFGAYQDAMTDAGWSLMHSRLSFSLNTKMLHPLEVIRAVEAAWRAEPERISLAQVEGFIRQILGWREYVRALYWQHMPDYAQHNTLNAQRALPRYYWDGDTKMACMAHSIQQSLDFAYAHHIQRLMITGNFALLAGVHPDMVDAWYLGIYIDAIEWVEMPNTRGMSQYADGGVIASKPYAASGQYIKKMSDYCTGCYYDVKARSGVGSCPFNSLYWSFIERHRARFSENIRMKLVYANWDRQAESQRSAILATASQYLNDLDAL
ncbi:cryptochrome/photolyase family protein [Salinispirillum sp. LH 10-3-1]|uniref:Cryptochrome/photolyase family protein n=1 Tax=Salinispirillum sp. LH 10-3-1 TaxID=2952525 RepID=A0AB38YFU3_9GAMM